MPSPLSPCSSLSHRASSDLRFFSLDIAYHRGKGERQEIAFPAIGVHSLGSETSVIRPMVQIKVPRFRTLNPLLGDFK